MAAHWVQIKASSKTSLFIFCLKDEKFSKEEADCVSSKTNNLPELKKIPVLNTLQDNYSKRNAKHISVGYMWIIACIEVRKIINASAS